MISFHYVEWFNQRLYKASPGNSLSRHYWTAYADQIVQAPSIPDYGGRLYAWDQAMAAKHETIKHQQQLLVSSNG
jgi:hypothetical protein